MSKSAKSSEIGTGNNAKKLPKDIQRGNKKGKKKTTNKNAHEDGDDNNDDNEGLSMDDILALGGNKEDLAMLADVDEGGEEEADFGGDDGKGGDDLKLDDIQSFVKKLGLPGFAAKTKAKDKDKDKGNKDKDKEKDLGKDKDEGKDKGKINDKATEKNPQPPNNKPENKAAETEDPKENKKSKKKKKKDKAKADAEGKGVETAGALSKDGSSTTGLKNATKKTIEIPDVTKVATATKPQRAAIKTQGSQATDSTKPRRSSESSTATADKPLDGAVTSTTTTTTTTAEDDTSVEKKGKKKKNKKKNKEPAVQFNEVSSSSQSPEIPPSAPPLLSRPSTSSSSPTFVASVVARWSAAHKVRRHALVKPGGRWFDQTPSDALVDVDDRSVSKECLVKLDQFALQLLKGDAACFQQSKTKFMKGDMAFIGNIINSGTLNDKTAAQTLLIQESPVHSLDNLDGLLNMAKKKVSDFGGNGMTVIRY